MKGSIKGVFRDMLVYGAGNIALRGLGFITMPVYTRVFSPMDYGILSFVQTVVGILNGVLLLGGDSAFARLFFEARTLEEKRRITSSWMIFLTLWTAATALLLLPLAPLASAWSFDSSDYKPLFVIAVLTAPVALIHRMFIQVLRNDFKAGIVSVYNFLTAALSFATGIFAVFVLDMGLIGVLYGFFIGPAVVIPALLWSNRAYLGPYFSLPVVRSHLAFGVPLVPASLAYWIFTSSDRIMLGKLAPLDELGFYAVGSALVGLLMLARQALGEAWSPHAVKVYEEDKTKASELYGRFFTYVLLAFGLLAVGLSTFAVDIVRLLASDRFIAASVIIAPLSLGVVAYATTQVTAIGISLSKKTYYFSVYAWIAAGLNVGLNYLFIPMWGFVAAAWTTTVCYSFLTVTFFLTSQRLFNVGYQNRRVLVGLIMTGVFTLVGPHFPYWPWYFLLPLKGTFVLAYVGGVVILAGLEPEEKTYLKRFVPIRITRQTGTA